MSLYEELSFFGARIAALSPQLAKALGNLTDYRAHWFSTDSASTVLIDPLHFFTAVASQSVELAPALRVEPNQIPLARISSSRGAVVRTEFMLKQGQGKPIVITRLSENGSHEIIDGESFVAWARESELTDVNVIALPCTAVEALILRVRLNGGPRRSLGGAGLVTTIVEVLKASPALVARLTSDPKAPGHLTQREAARLVFCLTSASSVNRALEILGYKSTAPKPVNEFGSARTTFRSVTKAAAKRDEREVLAALIAHKREVDQLLAKKLGVAVEGLETVLVKMPKAVEAPAT